MRDLFSNTSSEHRPLDTVRSATSGYTPSRVGGGLNAGHRHYTMPAPTTTAAATDADADADAVPVNPTTATELRNSAFPPLAADSDARSVSDTLAA